MRANLALRHGKKREYLIIIRELYDPGEITLECAYGCPQPNEPTVTVKATVNVSSAGAESGSTINLSIADSGYNSREINQYILNLFGINSEPDDGVVVTEPIRELIADLRKTARGLYRLVFSNLEIDARKDGILQSTVDRTNARVVSITASRIVGEYANRAFKAKINGQLVTRLYTREYLRRGVTAVLLRARFQAETAFARQRYGSSVDVY
jgi:hypothetical protein